MMIQDLNRLTTIWILWLAACAIEIVVVLKTLEVFFGNHNIPAGIVGVIGCCAMAVIIVRLRRKYRHLFDDWMRS